MPESHTNCRGCGSALPAVRHGNRKYCSSTCRNLTNHYDFDRRRREGRTIRNRVRHTRQTDRVIRDWRRSGRERWDEFAADEIGCTPSAVRGRATILGLTRTRIGPSWIQRAAAWLWSILRPVLLARSTAS